MPTIGVVIRMIADGMTFCQDALKQIGVAHYLPAQTKKSSRGMVAVQLFKHKISDIGCGTIVEAQVYRFFRRWDIANADWDRANATMVASLRRT
jgi:hypothetical protein